MTPSARCQATIEILEEIEKSAMAADLIIQRYFRKRRYAGSSDRRAIKSMVFATLRKQGQIDWWCEKYGIETKPRSRVLALSVLDPIWVEISSEKLFGGGQYGATLAGGREICFLNNLSGNTLENANQSRSVKYNLPAWLEGRYCAEIKENFDDEVKLFNNEAEIDIRVNILKSKREVVQVMLKEEGLNSTPTPWAPNGLRLAHRRPFKSISAFKSGIFEPQNEASQLAAGLAGVKPGDNVLDICAGAGGKSLAIAAEMNNVGRIVLSDLDSSKLRRAEERLRRAGVENYEIRQDIEEVTSGEEGRKKKFDIVILDVPCSGSGVWRRNPEAKWRLSSSHLHEFVKLQRRLLVVASDLVCPGGRLVYMTCSILAEENKEQIDWYMSRPQTAFERTSIASDWARVTGIPGCGDRLDIQFTPQRYGTDGFYVAILTKRTN